MTSPDAIRFLDHQARECRGRDACEALCLLLPAMMKIMGLERMEDFEAAAFRHGFKLDLAALADSPPGQPNTARVMRTGQAYDTDQTKELERSNRPVVLAPGPRPGHPA